MYNDAIDARRERSTHATPPTHTPREVYNALGSGCADGAVPLARAFLARELDAAAGMACDLPDDPAALDLWAATRQAEVTGQYKAYLAARKTGAPRRYFSSAAHALYFIRNVAPTKLVDGAWLYACLRHWQDNDYRPLIKTYLEELGEGAHAKNHVTLFQRLLDNHGINQWEDLGEAHFTQGAIQLALAHAGEGLLPETVGYNLGYEQLPLHLLITSYELNELGIDPYYFTLHLTVDNASTGHARDAIAAVRRLMARAGDPAEFYRRVRDGYKLNDLGECTTSVIAAFALEDELVRILAAKAKVGKDMHADYCRIGGRSINAWLAEPAQIPALLKQFEQTGWIKRGAAPAESRFWQLVDSERAEMFGVFSSYERQVLADWIQSPSDGGAADASPRVASFRARSRANDCFAAPAVQQRPRGLIRYSADGDEADLSATHPLRQLEQAVAGAASKADAMRVLIAQMSPARHHGAAGLMATRMFAALYA